MTEGDEKSQSHNTKTTQSKQIKSLLDQDDLCLRTEITLMFLSLVRKNKIVDIFRDITFAKKDPFLENLMNPEYKHFLKFKMKERQLRIYS